MNRITQVTLIVLSIAALAQVPASAQSDHRVEVLGGLHYTLTAAHLEVDQDAGLGLELGVRIGTRFVLGGQYQTFSTTDDLGLGGKVDMTFYGLTGTLFLNDDVDFRLLAVAGAGTGDLTYENPLPPDPVLADSTDFDLWYEVGLGVQFTAGQRWLFRLKVVGRRIDPDVPSVLIDQSRTMVLPSFQVGVKF